MTDSHDTDPTLIPIGFPGTTCRCPICIFTQNKVSLRYSLPKPFPFHTKLMSATNTTVNANGEDILQLPWVEKYRPQS